MKILVISKSFYPTISPRSFRTTELVKELCRKCHDVTLMLPEQNEGIIELQDEYNFTFQEYGPLKFAKKRKSNSGFLISIIQKLYRVLKILFEFPEIEIMYRLQGALKGKNGYDLLITIAVPHPIHWGVAKYYKNNDRVAKMWVADCGDPYMGKENDSIKPMFYFKYFEKSFCRMANFISVPTKGAKSAYYEEFRDKIRVIPQGFDFDIIDTKLAPSKNKKIRFAYAGGFIPNIRDPRPILEYLNRLERDFEFVLYTRQGSYIQDLVNLSKGRIVVKDFLPRKELLKDLYEMDFLINIENRGSKQTPSKLIDYAILQKPILSLNSSQLDTKVIDQFLDYNYVNTFVVENVDQYRIENVANKFLQLSS